MKLAIVSNLFGISSRGGAERIAALEAVGLSRRGHQVVVVCGTPESVVKVRSRRIVRGIEIVHGESVDGLETFACQSPNFFPYKELSAHSWPMRLAWHGRDMFSRRSAGVLSNLFLDRKTEAVHTHNLMGLGFAVPSALQRVGLRHLHTVHDVQLLHPSGLLPADWTEPRNLSERTYASLMRQRFGSPETVFWPSEFIRDLHLRLGFFPNSKQVLLRNPSPEATDEVDRAANVDGRVFLFVGQLEEHKGVLDLLAAWSQRSRQKGDRLVVVGDGHLESEVRKRVGDDRSVELRGRLTPEKLIEEYCRSDWLVVPSRVIENAPAVIGEALAYGLPVLAARSGGIPELIRKGENGLLFEPGDVGGLATVLDRAEKLTLDPGSLRMNFDGFLNRLENIFVN